MRGTIFLRKTSGAMAWKRFDLLILYSKYNFMFDIIRCEADAGKHGFEKFFSYNEVKGSVIASKDLSDAAQKRGKKALILVQDLSIDHGAVKLLGEKPKSKACLLFDMSRIIKSSGIRRAIEISMMRNVLRLCVKRGAFYAFATFAEKEGEIRSPEELMHIAMLLGINRGQAEFALKMLPHYL